MREKPEVVALDRRIRGFLQRNSPWILRWALAIVFLWFGLLKVTGDSPVVDLVAAAVGDWFDPSWFVPVLGAFEILVGLGLAIGKGIRATLLLFALQMAGTFLLLVLRPDIVFQNGNPLLLTTEGEFVIKNLVLLAAGMVVGAGVGPMVSQTRIRSTPA
ncbi:MAG: DoxX family membrane protein [Acidimicrobiia bacterium]